jgi:tryptophan 2,3-dioxygenase
MNDIKTPEIQERLQRLADKYAASGQDLASYLDGLIHANYLTYWDYIQVDTLLTLQKPRTDFPDEVIFIAYHQITELYFLLVHQELDQLLDADPARPDLRNEVLKRLNRILNYIRHLSDSFDVMTYGMDVKQFLDFRMSLLPASGFQTASFREIEFKMTGLVNLITADARAGATIANAFDAAYEEVYWKKGNIELATGRKTLTLRMFEQKYDERFKQLARDMEHRNLDARRSQWPAAVATDAEVLETMKQIDLAFNVFWRLSHYRSAARYLQRDPEVIKATGGTNWQAYLPPRFQKVYFFPGIWTEDEKAEWGKGWVLQLFQEQVESKWRTQMSR